MSIELTIETPTTPLEPTDRFVGLRPSGATPAEKAIVVTHSALLNPTDDMNYARHRAVDPRLKGVSEEFLNLGNISGPTDLDLSVASVFKAGLTNDVTFSFIGIPPSGQAATFTLQIIKATLVIADITWPVSVDWGDEGEPVLPDLGRVRFAFTTDDGGISWDAVLAFIKTE